jgi:FlaA1/EpsC-like NDP-sugar epimerase
VTVTHPEVTRYFMTIPEAASLVIQAGEMAEGGDVFLLEMGEPVRIVDLARRMIRLAGLAERTPERPDGDIEIAFTGLRPGEKLYEELLIDATAQATEHPMIRRAVEERWPWARLEPLLADLARACDAGDAARIVALLGEAVAGYAPSAEGAEGDPQSRVPVMPG